MPIGSKILQTAKEVALLASQQIDLINKGIFLEERENRIPQKYKFHFDVFREQLKSETYDFEGLRLRLEMYRAWKVYGRKNHDEAWTWSFGEDFKEDNFWRYLRLGFGYLLNCILTSERDIPVLASKFFPFCTTYNCKFRKGGCLFSICEDILTIIELLSKDTELKRDFKRKVWGRYRNEIESKLYDKLLNFIEQEKMLPPYLAENENGDPYVTIKFIHHYLNNNKNSNKNLSQNIESIIDKCIRKPQSKLYMPESTNGKIIIDNSPILKLKLAQLLLNFSTHKECQTFVNSQVTLAIDIIKNKRLEDLMGPIWGRDRYSSIGWCSHSDIFTIITAMDFLLDVLQSNFTNDTGNIITEALKDGIGYLLQTRNPNNTWPVTSIEKFKNWTPLEDGNTWDSKDSKKIDCRLLDMSEIFNISFSNTVGSIIVLLKANTFLKNIEVNKDE